MVHFKLAAQVTISPVKKLVNSKYILNIQKRIRRFSLDDSLKLCSTDSLNNNYNVMLRDKNLEILLYYLCCTYIILIVVIQHGLWI